MFIINNCLTLLDIIYMCAFENINNNDKSKYPSKENIFKLFFDKINKILVKTEPGVQCKRFNMHSVESNNSFLFFV